MKYAAVVLMIALTVVFGSALVQAEYFDFDGATITILSQSHHPAHRFLEGEWLGNATHGTAYGLHEEAEELFNCTIEFGVYSFPDYVEALMTRLLSGDAENDLWIMNSHQYWGLMAQGSFYPLNDVLSEQYFASLPGIPRGSADFMTFMGMRYGFGTVGGSMGGILSVVYLPDVFEELGLPDLQELYLEGRWTWDAMADIARQASGDTTGDGAIDRFGIMGLGRRPYLYPFLYTNNAALVDVVDGQLVFAGTQSRFLDSVNTVLDWITEGIASPDPNQMTVLDLPTRRAVMALAPLNMLNQLADYNYRVVPAPKGPNVTEHVHASVFIEPVLTLPANSRYPEGMVQLASFLYPREDYFELVEDLIRQLAKDRVSAQIMWEMHDNWSGYAQRLTQPNDGLTPAIQGLNQALSGRVPIASAMAEVAGSIEAYLDDFFNQ